MSFSIGDLVESEREFAGIGKLVSLDDSANLGTVAFFESPLRSEHRKIQIKLSALVDATIYDEAVVHLVDSETGLWRRARYGSKRPNGDHLVLFKSSESIAVPISEIYILNLGGARGPNPLEFLEARCTDTPYLSDLRQEFVGAYLAQRAACRSLSSILSSSVEIEPHQIAVVRQVLQDDIQKYLLADEVGLGKTIEACLVLREHVLRDEQSAMVVVAVPSALIEQWRSELTNRFYLGDLLDKSIFLCAHEKLAAALGYGPPTMIIIDEAHQICPWAWSVDSKFREDFEQVASVAANVETLLLLSGTPLSGNEDNFLAMLHLLSPDGYQLTEKGRQQFLKRLSEREHLGGMYQALVASNDNDTLTGIVDNIGRLFPEDKELHSRIAMMKPLIDWQASEEGKERSDAITNLRSYIGENFRLHQRMLRNRREDPKISHLFPGLAGASVRAWPIDKHLLSIDQTLDAYRDEHCGLPSASTIVNSTNLIEWIDLYLTSPMLVSEQAKHALDHQKGRLADHELELLDDLVFCGESEQLAKDKLLVECLIEHLQLNDKSKVVVFCGDRSVADHVFEFLVPLLSDAVERHDVTSVPDFSQNDSVRVLICDERGEDGLNLHGGHKVLVHYSVPLSFARIEQRNGRVNRYSAAIHARPVPCTVLVPNRDGLYAIWVDILNDTVNIFDESVASLQYVLQEEIDAAWQRVITDGQVPLRDLQGELSGENGLLEREKRKVIAQEELNSMNEEVERAAEFAKELETADIAAEAQADSMLGWITKGLHFERKPGEVLGSFRLRFSVGGVGAPRTLVDVKSFAQKCITGIDMEKSDWSAPVTSLMSPNRQLVSHGENVYPLRFGQPFVDTIYDLSKGDTRGICSALIRAVTGLQVEAPKIYFKFSWSVSACESDAAPRVRRLADGKYVPRFCTHWLNESREVVTDEFLAAILDCKYSKKAHRIGRELIYQDVNVSHQYWDQVEDYFPKSDWGALVRSVGETARSRVEEEATAGIEIENSALNYQLESLVVIILISGQG